MVLTRVSLTSQIPIGMGNAATGHRQNVSEVRNPQFCECRHRLLHSFPHRRLIQIKPQRRDVLRASIEIWQSPPVFRIASTLESDAFKGES
jgi:hypothetical protein